MLRSLVATVAAVALGVALSGCAGAASRPDTGHSPSGPAVDPAGVGPGTLHDTTWRLVSIGGKSVGRLHGRLHLGVHRFHADTGVNAVGGHLAVHGDRLQLRNVSSTAVGIVGLGSRWEGAQQDAYGNGDLVFVVQGHTLTLRPAGPGASPALVYRAS